jgi:hypothetical protein
MSHVTGIHGFLSRLIPLTAFQLYFVMGMMGLTVSSCSIWYCTSRLSNPRVSPSLVNTLAVPVPYDKYVVPSRVSPGVSAGVSGVASSSIYGRNDHRWQHNILPYVL